MNTKSQNSALKKMTNCWLIEKFGTAVKWDYRMSGHPAWVVVSRDEGRITVNCRGTASYEVAGSFVQIAEFTITKRGRIYQSLG